MQLQPLIRRLRRFPGSLPPAQHCFSNPRTQHLRPPRTLLLLRLALSRLRPPAAHNTRHFRISPSLLSPPAWRHLCCRPPSRARLPRNQDHPCLRVILLMVHNLLKTRRPPILKLDPCPHRNQALYASLQRFLNAHYHKRRRRFQPSRRQPLTHSLRALRRLVLIRGVRACQRLRDKHTFQAEHCARLGHGAHLSLITRKLAIHTLHLGQYHVRSWNISVRVPCWTDLAPPIQLLRLRRADHYVHLPWPRHKE